MHQLTLEQKLLIFHALTGVILVYSKDMDAIAIDWAGLGDCSEEEQEEYAILEEERQRYIELRELFPNPNKPYKPPCMKTYVTFGQNHIHRVNGIIFDKNSVAVVEGNIARVVELFGDKFCTTYVGKVWANANILHHFPRGCISVDGTNDTSAS